MVVGKMLLRQKGERPVQDPAITLEVRHNHPQDGKSGINWWASGGLGGERSTTPENNFTTVQDAIA